MSQPASEPHVIVTGAAGYVGRHVVTALLERGFRTRAVVRPGRGGEVDARADVVEADIFASDFEVASLVGEQTLALIHLAWEDGFVHNAPSHMLRLSSHFAFLSNAVAAGAQRLSVLGTMHEVGYWEGAIDADTPTAPRSLYGVAKDALRQSTQIALSDKVELAWLRCYYIFGDDRRNNSIFARLLEAADRGQQSFPFTTGKSQYDFIDVAELADQIAVASVTPGVTGVINCSSGEPVSLAAQVEAFIADNALGIELEYGAFPDRPYDSPAVWGDATRIRAIMAEHAATARG